MNEVQPADAASTARSELNGSLATVWLRFAGARPGNTETTINGNVVKCVMSDADLPQAPSSEDPPDADPRLGSEPAYRRDAMATVARLTGLPVTAMISDHRKKDHTATSTFILDDRRRRNRN